MVLSGVLSIAVKDGGTMEISAGDNFYLGDHQDLHRAASEQGAIVFVIDEANVADCDSCGPSAKLQSLRSWLRNCGAQIIL